MKDIDWSFSGNKSVSLRSFRSDSIKEQLHWDQYILKGTSFAKYVRASTPWAPQTRVHVTKIHESFSFKQAKQRWPPVSSNIRTDTDKCGAWARYAYKFVFALQECYWRKTPESSTTWDQREIGLAALSPNFPSSIFMDNPFEKECGESRRGVYRCCIILSLLRNLWQWPGLTLLNLQKKPLSGDSAKTAFSQRAVYWSGRLGIGTVEVRRGRQFLWSNPRTRTWLAESQKIHIVAD